MKKYTYLIAFVFVLMSCEHELINTVENRENAVTPKIVKSGPILPVDGSALELDVEIVSTSALSYYEAEIQLVGKDTAKLGKQTEINKVFSYTNKQMEALFTKEGKELELGDEIVFEVTKIALANGYVFQPKTEHLIFTKDKDGKLVQHEDSVLVVNNESTPLKDNILLGTRKNFFYANPNGIEPGTYELTFVSNRADAYTAKRDIVVTSEDDGLKLTFAGEFFAGYVKSRFNILLKGDYVFLDVGTALVYQSSTDGIYSGNFASFAYTMKADADKKGFVLTLKAPNFGGFDQTMTFKKK